MKSRISLSPHALAVLVPLFLAACATPSGGGDSDSSSGSSGGASGGVSFPMPGSGSAGGGSGTAGTPGTGRQRRRYGGRYGRYDRHYRDDGCGRYGRGRDGRCDDRG